MTSSNFDAEQYHRLSQETHEETNSNSNPFHTLESSPFHRIIISHDSVLFDDPPRLEAFSQAENKESYTSTVQSDRDTGDGTRIEQRGVPKPITRNDWLMFLSGWLIHVPAVVATAAVLWVGSNERFWFAQEGSHQTANANTVRDILQFAVKLHEILIIASLSSIAVCMLRRSLIGDGVRLGFLTGGYRVGDLYYLVSSSFRRQGLGGLSPWEILLAVYVVFATILSTIVLPASANLLIPELEWFHLDHGQAFSNLQMPLIYQADAGSLWPERFTSGWPWNDTSDCVKLEGIYSAGCPAGGFTEIWNWVDRWSSTNLENSLNFDHPSTGLRRQLKTTVINPAGGPVLSTTPSHRFMINFGLFHKYIDRNDNNVGEISGGSRYQLKARRVNQDDPEDDEKSSPIYQPFIQTKCRVYVKEIVLATNGSIAFPIKSLECFGDESCLKLQALPSEPLLPDDWSKAANDKGRSLMSQLEPFDDGSSLLRVAGHVPDPTVDDGQEQIYTCAMLASWVASEYSIDPKESDILYSSLNKNAMEHFEKKSFAGKEEGYVIKFDKSWFNYLSPSLGSSGASNSSQDDDSALTRIVDLFKTTRNSTTTYNPVSPLSDREDAEIEVFLAKVFGVYLTEAIARTGPARTATILRLQPETEGEVRLVDMNEQYLVTDGVYTGTSINATASNWTSGSDTAVVPFPIQDFNQELTTEYLGFDFEAERYGWGTGKQTAMVMFGRVIMYIYFAVLGLYALTRAGAHVLEMTGWHPSLRAPSVVPWADLQDLLILALKTPPPKDGDLQDAGAGVTSPGVWKKRVRAMADGHHNVQLVLDEDTAKGKATVQRLDTTGKEKYF